MRPVSKEPSNSLVNFLGNFFVPEVVREKHSMYRCAQHLPRLTRLPYLSVMLCALLLSAALGVGFGVRAVQSQAVTPAQTNTNTNAKPVEKPAPTLGELLTEARTLYLRGDYRTAYAHYEQVRQLAERQGDKSALMTALRGLGNVHFSLGDHHPAYVFYQRSLKQAEELQDKSGILDARFNLGNICYGQGDYGNALEQYQRSRLLAAELNDAVRTVRALNNIGSIYQLQANFPLALETHQRALKLVRALNDADLMTKSLNNLGLTQLALNEYTAALAAFEEAFKLAETNDFKPLMMLALNNLAIVNEAQGQYARAETYYQQGLRLAETLESKESLAFLWSNLGNTRRLQGQYRQAIELTERAIHMARQIGNLEVLAKASTRAGKSYAALGQPEQAQQHFAAAIRAVEQLRNLTSVSERDRQRFLEARIGPYYGMVELLIAKGLTDGISANSTPPAALTEALEYAQRAKGRVLLDVLQSGKANLAKAMTEKEAEQERKLTRDLNALNSGLYLERLKPTPNEKRLSELDQLLQRVRLEHEGFQAALYAAHPELKIQRGELQPLNLNEIANLLPDARTAILEFIVAEDQSYLFVMTKPAATTPKPAACPINLQIYPLNLTRKLVNDLTERFRRRIANRHFDIQELSGELHHRLLAPAQAQLQGMKALIVIPDGGLWQLPFQALQAGNGHYLIEDYSLSYAPSLPVLQAMTQQRMARQQTAPGSPSLFALGNPVLGKQESAQTQAMLMGDRLTPLPETARQVNALKHVYGAQNSRVLLGAFAREDLLKAEAGQYRILHLATHGILNDASPLYSQLLLSQPLASGAKIEAASASDDPGEDGLLEAWEIMRMNLHADLVVLSACETARGRIGSGEGMIGLTWAFFIAGSPANVVSQWKVESRSTADLMLAFHRQLQPRVGTKHASLNTAEALRQASLLVLRKPQYRHPFYWAGFVLIGASR